LNFPVEAPGPRPGATFFLTPEIQRFGDELAGSEKNPVVQAHRFSTSSSNASKDHDAGYRHEKRSYFGF
jgi:hypothetical protein